MDSQSPSASQSADDVRPATSEHHGLAEISRLQSLPAELRNHIYQLAVVHERSVDAAVHATGSESTGLSPCHWRFDCVQPALAATCRQIRNEILPIYYGENVFRFKIWTACSGQELGWWEVAARPSLPHLKHVACGWTMFSPRSAQHYINIKAEINNEGCLALDYGELAYFCHCALDATTTNLEAGSNSGSSQRLELLDLVRHFCVMFGTLYPGPANGPGRVCQGCHKEVLWG